MHDKPIPSSDPLEVAWAAGLFEGEGSFHTHRHRSANEHVYARATLAMTDEDVVRRFHRIVGVGKVLCRAECRPGRKPIWRWAAQSRQAYAHVVALFEPFLGERRKEQLALVAAQLTPHTYHHKTGLRTHCMAGHLLTPDNIAFRGGDRMCRTCLRTRRRDERRRAAKRRGSWAGV
jgi:hypothetical protein